MSETGEARHASPGQAVTFRVGAPGSLLIVWTCFTGVLAMGMFIAAATQPWAAGHPPGAFALFIGLLFFASGPVILIARLGRHVKWVRVRAEHGLLLATGQEVAWADVLTVGARSPLVEIRTRTVGLLTLRHVEDAARFEALVRRYTTADVTRDERHSA